MAVKNSRTSTQHVASPKPARNAAGAVPAEAPRTYTTRSIAALLAPVLRPAFRKRAPAAAQLLADWPALAGPDLAACAAPVKFAAGTLTLACTGPVAMQLQLSAPMIIQRLNLGLGSAMVERLRFLQQAVAALPLPQRPTRPLQTSTPPDNLPEGALGEALARLAEGLQGKG